jgi:S-formylglutathione hydrolase FrmB
MRLMQPRRTSLLAVCFIPLITLVAVPDARAFGRGERTVDLRQLNRQIAGRVDDFTCNHGEDNRIFSASLGQKRDVYVYVPPGYDPAKRYPLVVWLHGLNQDETSFLQIVPEFDRAIVNGSLPKFVAVAPDGTVNGRAGLREPPTLYLNSRLGRFEDFVTIDVWNHVVTNYSIRAERQAHVLAGASMGAFGAYNLGIKHKADFGVVAGVLPPLNLRYADCYGRIDTDFNPSCFGTLTEYNPNQVIARLACGLIKIRERDVIAPAFGEGPDVMAKVAAENPAEMLAAFKVKPGELEMFASYGTRDEFNFDAQTESFAYIARGQGLTVNTFVVPGGKHDKQTAMQMLPAFVDFLSPRLKPYAPKD